MKNTDLLSYIGAITGLIGTITGIAGAVMGYLSYRKTNEIKALELRLEIMKTGVDAFQKAEDLVDLLARAKRSRNAVAAAMGMRQSGAYERWVRQHTVDEESLSAINESVDQLNVDYSKAPLRELEQAIGEIQSLKTIVNCIMERYLGSIVEDDRNRESIRQQAHARVNS
tara:strand:+ start:64708 stop:65217 length:510 start_codon:yes stop_codon:yes gene_type:complete